MTRTKAELTWMKECKKLKKENYELSNDEIPSVSRKIDTIGAMLKHIEALEKENKKAKEIIRQLCLMVRELNNPSVMLTNVDYSLSEAEQFLKEEL